MYCEKCGHQLQDGSLFCDQCGAKQQKTVFCIQCGKRIPADVMYCDGCGASQKIVESNPFTPAVEDSPLDTDSAQAKSKKAPHKKKLIKSIALVLVSVFIVGILVSILFPAKETVYVLTEITAKYQDSERIIYECELEYDKNGNPSHDPGLRFDGRNNRLSYAAPEKIEYDNHGNIVESEYGRELKYSYDLLGRIQTCEEYFQDGDLYATWSYTWDINGRLVQVISDLEEGWDSVVRADFEYDWKGRLVNEYFFFISDDSLRVDKEISDVIDILGIEYKYDIHGNLQSVARGWSNNHDTYEMDLCEIDIEYYDMYKMVYDDSVIAEIEYDKGGHFWRNPSEYDADWVSKEFEYDRKGNLESQNDDIFEYDKYGNITTVVSRFGTVWEFEYEEVQMTKSAAERYYHWERLLYMDVDSLLAGSLNLAVSAAHPSFDYRYSYQFYYYLIPNPLW